MRVLSQGFVVGNRERDRDHKQWWAGPFYEEGDPRYSTLFQMKTANHPAGAERLKEHATEGQALVAVEVLREGRFSLYFEVDGKVEQFDLDADGDNILIWPPGYPHWWKAHTDVIIDSFQLLPQE